MCSGRSATAICVVLVTASSHRFEMAEVVRYVPMNDKGKLSGENVSEWMVLTSNLPLA